LLKNNLNNFKKPNLRKEDPFKNFNFVETKPIDTWKTVL